MTDTTAAAKPRRLFSLLLGLTGGVLGIAPWLATGGILPLQNLWFEDVAPEDMRFVLLPVSQ